MKVRHARNPSLPNPHSHPRSLPQPPHSHPRKPHPSKPNPRSQPPQQYLIQQSATLPRSTNLTREPKPTRRQYVQKPPQLIIKEGKKGKSRERERERERDRPREKEKAKREKQSLSREEPRKKDNRKQRKSQERAKSDQSGDCRLKKPTTSKQFSTSKYWKPKSGGTSPSKPKQQQNKGTGWEQVVEEYGEYLSEAEIQEMKQYKWIYYLGSIRDRLSKKLFLSSAKKHALSARGHEGSEGSEGPVIMSERKDARKDSAQADQGGEFYNWQVGDHIAYRYELEVGLGRGSFGEVVRVFDHRLQQHLALKIVKKCPQLVQQTFVEISILTHLKQQDGPSLSGIVRIQDFTIFRNHICILFELLQSNLYELLSATGFRGLPELTLRLIAVQLLNSLAFLRREGVVHCDIKPENIVLRKWGKSGVKVVDFGTSCFQGKQLYQYLQSRYYRAPEIILRQPYSFPIDMWSLACLLAELRTGQPLFTGSTDTEQLLYFLNAIGAPMKEDGPHSTEFLRSEEMQEIMKEDYLRQYNRCLQEGTLQTHPLFSQCKYIRNCMRSLEEKLMAEDDKDFGFVDFLRRILVWEPDKRLTPQEALNDPWIVKGLPQEIKSLYTIFHTAEAKSKSKESKKGKRSKPKSKELSVQKKREFSVEKRESGGWESRRKEPATEYKLRRNYHKSRAVDLPFK